MLPDVDPKVMKQALQERERRLKEINIPPERPKELHEFGDRTNIMKGINQDEILRMAISEFLNLLDKQKEQETDSGK